jgi:hypothetical protein
MQYAHIMLALGGDGGNQVPKFFVTPAEVLILQAIHGDQSVTEVDILDLDDDRVSKNMTDEQREELEDRTNAQDLARLREDYRFARVDDGNGSQLLVMNSLFPGAGAKAPESFSDIDTIPDEFYKAEDRKVPRKTAKKSTKKADAKSADKDDEDDKKVDEKKAADAKAADEKKTASFE